jgi:hypothetical protein
MVKTTIVEVSQFLPPNGRRIVAQVELPSHIKEKYESIISSGCRLTYEVLGNGVASMTIEEPALGDFVIRLSPSGQKADLVLTKMIESFNQEEFDKWKNQRKQFM